MQFVLYAENIIDFHCDICGNLRQENIDFDVFHKAFHVLGILGGATHNVFNFCGDIIDALLDRDPVKLRQAIATFLLESVSYFDAAAEGFFHGLTLGFLAVLRGRFRVLSNVESGEGRFDIALKPLVEPFPAFIIEVKRAANETEDLKALAAAARAQIDGRQYDATFRAEGFADIVKIGLAYYRNKVELCTEIRSDRSLF